MQTSKNIIDSFIFHDAILNSISFDIVNETLTAEFENEIEQNKLQVLSLLFRNVRDFRSDFVSFLDVSEVYSMKIVPEGEFYFLEMTVLLGFGKHSGRVSFLFSTCDAFIL